MEFWQALVVIAVLVGATAAFGALWRSRQGRVHAPTAADAGIKLVDLGLAPAPNATILQFSTEYCARCPATRRALHALAESRPGVGFREFDLTHAPDVARRYRISQTPTIFVLDDAGRVRSRIGGAPRISDVRELLDSIDHANDIATDSPREGADHVS